MPDGVLEAFFPKKLSNIFFPISASLLPCWPTGGGGSGGCNDDGGACDDPSGGGAGDDPCGSGGATKDPSGGTGNDPGGSGDANDDPGVGGAGDPGGNGGGLNNDPGGGTGDDPGGSGDVSDAPGGGGAGGGGAGDVPGGRGAPNTGGGGGLGDPMVEGCDDTAMASSCILFILSASARSSASLAASASAAAFSSSSLAISLASRNNAIRATDFTALLRKSSHLGVSGRVVPHSWHLVKKYFEHLGHLKASTTVSDSLQNNIDDSVTKSFKAARASCNNFQPEFGASAAIVDQSEAANFRQ